MDVFLTEEEKKREQDLFKPHEKSYKKLRGREYQLKDFSQNVKMDSDAVKPPPSC